MKRIIFFFAMFLLITFSPFAQSPQELRLGGVPVSGTLYFGSEIWYSVRAMESGLITIETTGDTDTYLEAYDEWGNLITENDDGGEGFNARIEIFAAAGRTYLFKLRGFGGYSTGPYRIWASSAPLPISRELRFDQMQQDYIYPGERNWYSVRTSSAGYIVTETIGGEVDTYMYLYDSNYNLLMQNDDGGSGLNARIEFLADPNQTYFFVVRAFNSHISGSYSIFSSYEPIPPDTDRNTDRSRAVTVRLGEAMPVFFREVNESRWYRYEAPRDGTVFVVQTRGSLDTTLLLYDSLGRLIQEDSYSGDYPNGLIYERLNAGTYFIEVRTFTNGAGVTGRCTLHAETR